MHIKTTAIYYQPEILKILCEPDSCVLASSGEQAAAIAPITVDVDNFVSEDLWNAEFDIDLR